MTCSQNAKFASDLLGSPVLIHAEIPMVRVQLSLEVIPVHTGSESLQLYLKLLTKEENVTN